MIALYIRLSEADQDLSEEKEESNSISNQRAYLREFVSAHPEWKDETVEEFVDDGYSGTTFNRPAFQRMLSLIKQRIVNTVIVKDFSRFGRDYIEVGDYMERFFPFMGVRFIALMEEYDSDRREVGDDQDLTIVMKNILNSYYSKDLSQKITSTIRRRRANGEFIYAARPFGYLIDPEDSTKVIMDPVAGPYVRLIFDLALQGKNTREIAIILNEKGIPTNLEYNRRAKVKGKITRPASKDSHLWKTQGVVAILKNDFYCGNYVSGNCRRVATGHTKMRKLREDEVVRIANHHPAIVSVDEFERARKVIQTSQARTNNKPASMYPLRGKLLCANCGRVMTRNERSVIGSYYTCPLMYKLRDDFGCSKERYNEEDLEALLLRQLKLWFQLVMDLDMEVKQRDLERAVQVAEIQDRIERLQVKQKETQRKKVALYECYSEGEISSEEFIPERDRLSAEVDGYRAKIEALFKEEQNLRLGKSKRLGEFEHLLVQVRIFNKEEKLTREMTEAFLDHVSIMDPEHMEIHWRWQDLVDEIRGKEGR